MEQFSVSFAKNSVSTVFAKVGLTSAKLINCNFGAFFDTFDFTSKSHRQKVKWHCFAFEIVVVLYFMLFYPYVHHRYI